MNAELQVGVPWLAWYDIYGGYPLRILGIYIYIPNALTT
jgi:hypothetical protein